MEPTMVQEQFQGPVTDFERGLAYGKMCSDIESLRARITKLEIDREDAQATAERAVDIATDAIREATDARDEVAEIADEVEQTTDTLETVAVAEVIADAAVADAEQELAAIIVTESETSPDSDSVTVIPDGGEDETPRQEPEVEPETHPRHHRRGGVYGRRR